MDQESKRDHILEELRRLARVENQGGTETNHCIADQLLLDLIDDEEITEAFDSILKWYA